MFYAMLGQYGPNSGTLRLVTRSLVLGLTVGLELGEALLVNGVDAGAERRAAIRAANTARQAQEAHRATRKGQDRAQEARRARTAQQPAQPLKRRREPSTLHPAGMALLLEALR